MISRKHFYVCEQFEMTLWTLKLESKLQRWWMVRQTWVPGMASSSMRKVRLRHIFLFKYNFRNNLYMCHSVYDNGRALIASQMWFVCLTALSYIATASSWTQYNFLVRTIANIFVAVYLYICRSIYSDPCCNTIRSTTLALQHRHGHSSGSASAALAFIAIEYCQRLLSIRLYLLRFFRVYSCLLPA